MQQAEQENPIKKKPIKQWFNNLKRQEQLLLLAGGAVFIIYFLVVVLWKPMSASIDILERQSQDAAESLQNVQLLAEEYRGLQGSAATGSGAGKQNLTRLIDSLVKKNKLVMKRFQPSSSGDVQIRFENTSFKNVLAWINELETDNGVIVKDLSVSPGNGSGLVNISIRLHQGAANG